MANKQYSNDEKEAMVAEFNKRVAAGISATKAAQGLGANPVSIKNWAKASAKPLTGNGFGDGKSSESDKVVFQRRGWKIEITPPAAATTARKSDLIKALTDNPTAQAVIRQTLKMAKQQSGSFAIGESEDADPDDESEDDDEE